MGGGVYEADASLSGLPAGFTTITANVNGKSAISGAINVVRAHSVVDNTEGIYWTMAGGAVYDPSTGNYVVDNGAELIGYAKRMVEEIAAKTSIPEEEEEHDPPGGVAGN